MRGSALLAAILLGGCGMIVDWPPEEAPDSEAPESEAPQSMAIFEPGLGSNEIFHEATAAAPGHELIVADLLLPPDAVGVSHWHPWEEYLYVIGGSAVLDIEGMDSRELAAGEHFVIPRQTVHTPRAGPDGIRAIIVRVHDEGDPVMVPAETAGNEDGAGQ